MSQTHGDLELIIVDGGSHGEVLSLIRDSMDLRCRLIVEPDRGLFDAINKGLELATGDYVGLMGSDDFLPTASVLADVDTYASLCSPEGVYGDCLFVSKLGATTRYWQSGVCRRWKVLFGWLPPHFCLYLRRDVVTRLGKYDLSYRIAADSDYLIRLLWAERVALGYIPKPLLAMEEGGLSNRNLANIVRANAEVFKSWSGHSWLGAVIAPIAKPLSKVFQTF